MLDTMMKEVNDAVAAEGTARIYADGAGWTEARGIKFHQTDRSLLSIDIPSGKVLIIRSDDLRAVTIG